MPLPEPRCTTAEDAVPAGRVDYDLSAERLLCHSVLSPAAWEQLAGTGMLTGRADLVDRCLLEAYDWLCAQAAARIPGATGCYPVWVWARITRRELVRQVRWSARSDPGSVLVTARIDRDRVLLSHFDGWHYVLNRWPMLDYDPGWEEATDAWRAKLDHELPDWPNRPLAMWPHYLRSELESSWQAIFEVEAYPRADFWQGTVEELRAADVVDAVRLRS